MNSLVATGLLARMLAGQRTVVITTRPADALAALAKEAQDATVEHRVKRTNGQQEIRSNGSVLFRTPGQDIRGYTAHLIYVDDLTGWRGIFDPAKYMPVLASTGGELIRA